MAPAKVKSFVDTKIQGKKVVVFSKTTCGFCAKAKRALQQFLGKDLSRDDYEVVERDKNPDMKAIQDYLYTLTGARSVPRVFINGKFFGGGDDTAIAARNGKLKAELTK